MKIGILIATYYRNNGLTKLLLKRALESIKNQTHQDYIVFLIGDKYENVDEFNELATSIIPKNKIIYENLENAIEREKYLNKNKQALWCSGGVNARNHGLGIARNYVEYCCQLDDDDYYLDNHLHSINEVIETKNDAAFIHTLSLYVDDPVFPNIGVVGDIIERNPAPSGLIHSSACLNIKKINLKYRDTLAEIGVALPADYDMWGRLATYCKEHNLKTYCIRKLTCVHPTEKSLLEEKINMEITQKSLDLLLEITDQINNQTFHHHYHILYDIANTLEGEINYVEIGCYAGGSACLMLQRPNTNVISIDIGQPIPKSVVIDNVNKLNKHNNKYCYLEGNSQSDQMFQRLYKTIKTIDILFIDGDHTYHGVWNDFHQYEKLVKAGGYIVFDDYHDFNAPGVKKAVDELILNHTNYDIIGTLENKFHARGFSKDFTKNNCFILRKKTYT